MDTIIHNFIDLHVHSTCSDGTCTPEDLVSLAEEKHLRAIAITDHDCVSGVKRALSAAESAGSSVEIIPGIEISADWQGMEIHILGLDIDPWHSAILSYQEEFLKEREERNKLMAERITAAGCPVTAEEVQERFPGAILGRPHYARIMMEKGFVTSLDAAFKQYLGDRGPCYVSRRRISASDACSLLLACKGKPVLAHPFQYRLSKERLESLVDYLKGFGLQGMECLYSGYSPSDMTKLQDMAKRHGLFISGGSDFHGDNKPSITLGSGIRGELQIPYSLLTDAGIR